MFGCSSAATKSEDTAKPLRISCAFIYNSFKCCHVFSAYKGIEKISISKFLCLYEKSPSGLGRGFLYINIILCLFCYISDGLRYIHCLVIVFAAQHRVRHDFVFRQTPEKDGVTWLDVEYRSGIRELVRNLSCSSMKLPSTD